MCNIHKQIATKLYSASIVGVMTLIINTQSVDSK